MKKPEIGTKHDEFSLVLWGSSILFVLMRFFWPQQAIKFVIRLKNCPESHIHPLVTELYVAAFLSAEILFCVFASKNSEFVDMARDVSIPILILSALRIFEVVSSNLYYMVLRPIVDSEARNNDYRSFILACLGAFEVWLLFSIVWFFLGSLLLVEPRIETIGEAIYFSTVSFFTVGYGDFAPSGAYGRALSVVSMFCSAILLLIILSRSLSSLRPPPTV